jgi:hypothetical protein
MGSILLRKVWMTSLQATVPSISLAGFALQ